MTIASALSALNTDIQNARTAITNKGGTVTPNGGSSQLAADIGTIVSSGYEQLPSYDINENGIVIKKTKVLDGTEFLDIKKVPSNTMKAMFSGCNLSGYLNLCNLIEIEGSGLYQTFNQCPIDSVNFDNLETIGSMGLYQCFMYSRIETINFKKLTDITAANALRNAFQNLTTYLKNVYFPALTTTSFGSNNTQFTTMLSGTTGTTLHFPSNLETIIQGISGYPSYGGTDIVIAFDLPATL
jgi:hypothetical protein